MIFEHFTSLWMYWICVAILTSSILYTLNHVRSGWSLQNCITDPFAALPACMIGVSFVLRFQLQLQGIANGLIVVFAAILVFFVVWHILFEWRTAS